MSGNIYKKKVLITVKTYPTLSSKYDELVCTAGITEDGEWIRIYPMPFRKLDDYMKYGKYQWIELGLIKNPTDPRPETYRPYHTPANIVIKGEISTGDDRMWTERKKYVLKNVYDDLDKLIKENKNDKGTSLAIFKPTEVLDFIIEDDEREWNEKKLKLIEEKSKQTNMFEEDAKVFKIMPKLPYKFKYKFKDINGKISTIMIEDWELGQLYWNCFKKYKDEKIACQKVKEKYFDYFNNRDLHFFMGTTRQFDGWAHNPFVIIGAFYPPKDERLSLF